MARLMCETKLAYYPTDPKTLKIVIDRFLRFNGFSNSPNASSSFNAGSNKKTFVLDPCCATGRAVSVFNEVTNASIYGIELDEERARRANSQLDRLLQADALYGVRKSNDWAGVLFLNPPYGLTALKERLELVFVEKYAQCVTKGGVMILAINPSSLDEKMAAELKNSGYRPIVSIYDPDNEDYKNYKQFFIVLQRIDKKYRYGSSSEMLEAIANPISIEQAQAEPIDVALGSAPTLFKEVDLPVWKLDELLSKSKLDKRIEALMSPSSAGRTSIEAPNEGQAALLLASGVLNQPIGDWLMKGQVVKVSTQTEECDPETGEPTNVVARDNYKTVLFGFNPNPRSLEFARFE
jgi:predicted RNA methylase